MKQAEFMTALAKSFLFRLCFLLTQRLFVEWWKAISLMKSYRSNKVFFHF